MRESKKRAIDGILVVDKWKGISSNGVLQCVKSLYNAKKAGHSGSLDPLATGVLPVFFGQATKFTQFILNADKVYHVWARLGIKTTTGDAEGDVVETKSVKVNRTDVERVLAEFVGEIEQIPPMFSAVKHQGTRLYELARTGIEVVRPSLKVHVFYLELLSMNGDVCEIKMHVSKGTYVRTLIEDVGARLGCGAHVFDLCRLRAGSFSIDQVVGLDLIQNALSSSVDGDTWGLDKFLLGVDTVLMHYPAVHVGKSVAYYLSQGQAIQVPKSPTEGYVRLYQTASDTNYFIGLGEVLDDGRIAPRRIILC